MKQEEIDLQYGLFRFTKEYTEAARSIFPNANDIKLGGCMLPDKKELFQKKVVYFCPKCRILKQQWLKQPGNNIYMKN
ncbi:hypothetical protein ACFL2B_00085 [Patescibacteria group bacterium]